MTASTEEQLLIDADVLDVFYRDGLAVVPSVLSADECAHLRELTDRLAVDPGAINNGHVTDVQTAMVLRYIQGLDQVLADLTIREPLHAYAEAIVGQHPKLCGMNVIRNRTDQAISSWHVDDMLEIPLGPGQTRHDPSMRMPVIWFTIQIALSDIVTYEQGPTEFVPGSHYSGRGPSAEDLTFDGQGPVAVYCKAGDAYLFNHQIWHRGAPNSSADTRYLMQIQYCRSSIYHRFSDKKNTEPPPNLDKNNRDLLDVLGIPA